MTEPPIIIAIDGFLAPKLRRIDIGRDLAALGVLVLASLFGWNGWPKALDWWIDRQVAKLAPPGRTFVALGFSAGAKAAARLAERNPHCVGLIFVSGTEWSYRDPWEFGYRVTGDQRNTHIGEYTHPLWWRGFPALCLCTHGELDALTDGTAATAKALKRAGANVTCPDPAPNPGTHRKPHLAGVAHHLPAIRAWMDQQYGATP